MTSTKVRMILVACLLLAGAAVFRFYGLGNLGWYGDEETSAFPARAMASGVGTTMPTGMPYYRALPMTIVNAGIARHVGLDAEAAYRIFPALCGTLTVLLLFVQGRHLVGSGIAVLAAVLLAVSEWHILTSREARMYAPFLLCFLSAAFCSWQWILHGGYWRAVLLSVLVILSLSLHSLAVLFLALPWAMFVVARERSASIQSLVVLTFATLAVYWFYEERWVVGAFTAWRELNGGLEGADGIEIRARTEPLAGLTPIHALLAVAGVIAGLLVARSTQREPMADEWLAKCVWYVLLALFAGTFALGWLYAAVLLATAVVLVHPGAHVAIFRFGWKPLIGVALIGLVGTALRVDFSNFWGTTKELFTFPYPYLAYFVEYTPGVFMFFVLGLGWLAFTPWSPGTVATRASAVGALAISALLGLVSKWAGMRYLIGMYPFFLIVASYGIIRCGGFLVDRKLSGAYAVGIALALLTVSGAMGGHGLPQAVRATLAGYGSAMSPLAFGFPIYPDHKGAGLFVRQNLRSGDLVVAEDALQQRWYVGRVDYWLREPEAAKPYLYRADDGSIRDFYVGARLLTDEMLIDGNVDFGRAWVITSAETRPEQALSVRQRQWLESLMKNGREHYRARDGVTVVYCVQHARTNSHAQLWPDRTRTVVYGAREPMESSCS